MACLTQFLDEFLDACNIAKKEIKRKSASIQAHQAGESEQHVAVQVLAMKINGVMIQ